MASIFRVEKFAEQETSVKAGGKQSDILLRKKQWTFKVLHGVIAQNHLCERLNS
jgi:hypothetical protein